MLNLTSNELNANIKKINKRSMRIWGNRYSHWYYHIDGQLGRIFQDVKYAFV